MKPDIKQFNPDEELLKYYESKASFEDAWNDCERGDWMLRIAISLKVEDRVLTKAKALCANTIRYLMKELWSTNAVDAALRYADGEISRKELDWKNRRKSPPEVGGKCPRKIGQNSSRWLKVTS
jgi:hypothetical protein